ncbi:MAG: aldo/keto reductase [Verrucomicrobiota bacterium]
MNYSPHADRYANSDLYKRCGRSGIKLSRLSIGLWHNFGTSSPWETQRELICGSFDRGITHFDLANNYGPPPGAAEENFGSILRSDLSAYRDELIISTKAGYLMWDGPYGDFGSRKYLISSLDQSLKRLGLDYVDIFYHHRPDPETPIEETMGALDYAVRSGRALYIALSNYNREQTEAALAELDRLGTPCLIHQPKYNMFHRAPEKDQLLDLLEEKGVGCIPFSPLAQGLLTNRYIDEIPSDSRIAKGSQFLSSNAVNEELRLKLRQLKEIADARGQSLAQFALAWVLRKSSITTVLIGCSKISQIDDNLQALKNTEFSSEEEAKIDSILE